MVRNASVKCEVNGIQFPSKLEAKTYLVIQEHYRYPVKVAAIEPHKVLIKEQTLHFAPIYWKVDFYLPRHDVYVESKGIFELEWKLKMKMLDISNPSLLDRLIIVSTPPTRCPWKGAATVSLKQLALFLQQLK